MVQMLTIQYNMLNGWIHILIISMLATFFGLQWIAHCICLPVILNGIAAISDEKDTKLEFATDITINLLEALIEC